MDFTTDLQIKKWKPHKNQEIKRVGKGLYVRGFLSGRKLFQIRYKQKWIDLGNYGDKTLSTASELALASIRKLKSNEVSINELKASLARSSNTDDFNEQLERKIDAPAASPTGIPTFSELYREWYKESLNANRWTHKSSISKPIQSFETHLEDEIGNLSIDLVTRSMLREKLQAVFNSHQVLGRDLRRFVDEVMERACDKELIPYNPCPPIKNFTIDKNKKTKHHASLNYKQLPTLWQWIDDQPFSQCVRVAMKTAIITAHRAGVIAHARWEHIDLDEGVWSIPEKPEGRLQLGYMKLGRQFVLKLPEGLLREIRDLSLHNQRHPEFVFAPLGGKNMNAETLRRNFRKFGDITTHGMRNTFKTWALNNDVSDFLADRYVDHALVGLDKAYRRDDLFEQRAELAEHYYAYVTGAK